jgi:hypothetical protein
MSPTQIQPSELLAALENGRWETRYLRFELQPAALGQKTDVWKVVSVRHGNLLGVIKWYGAWRQYVFWPSIETLFNPDCLEEISQVCRGLMALRD